MDGCDMFGVETGTGDERGNGADAAPFSSFFIGRGAGGVRAHGEGGPLSETGLLEASGGVWLVIGSMCSVCILPSALAGVLEPWVRAGVGVHARRPNRRERVALKSSVRPLGHHSRLGKA